jgi:hypothetical protein
MKLPLSLLFALLSIATPILAQPNKKVGPALSRFLNTEFMVKYRDLRIGAESAALSVQSNRGQMKPEDVIRLRTAYDQTAFRANQLLDNVRQDFLNGKKLRSIAEFPDMYADGLAFKLTGVRDFYAANFQQTLADLTPADSTRDGSATLLLVIELISLTKGLTGYFAELRREARSFTEAHLQENLVQPYRWRYWDELAGQVSPYERYEPSAQLPLQPSPAEAKLQEQIQKLNQVVTTLPAAAPGTTPETVAPAFNPPPDGDPTVDSTNAFQYENWSPTAKPEEPAGVRSAKPGVKSSAPAAKRKGQQ